MGGCLLLTQYIMWTTKAIEELQQIWRDETGEDLSREEAEAMGLRLLRFMQVVARASAERQRREETPDQRNAPKPAALFPACTPPSSIPPRQMPLFP